LVVYLTLTPILGAIDKQDVANLKAVLGRSRIVARFLDLGSCRGYLSLH